MQAMESDHPFEFEWMGHYREGYPLVAIDGHSYVKITKNQSDVSVVRTLMRDEDIADLCERASAEVDFEWTLHILLSSSDLNYGDALPYSAKATEALRKYWKIGPSSFVFPFTTKATTYSPDRDNADWKGIRLTTTFGRQSDLVITHNERSRQTFAVVYSNETWVLEQMMVILLERRHETLQPYLLPFVFVEQYLENLESYSHDLTLDTTRIERSLGCDQYFWGRAREDTLDIADMPVKLASLTHAVAHLCAYQETSAAQIMFAKDLLKTIPRADNDEAFIQIQDRLRLSQERCNDAKYKAVYMKEKLHSMVQMVYALLQQRDNEINHRYAANVNVITAITLIFLPGTFVATLFSSSFWNFGPESERPVVSRWVWLYFVLTAVLTLLVLGIWRGYTVLKQSIKTAKNVWRSKIVSKLLRRGKKDGDVESGTKVE